MTGKRTPVPDVLTDVDTNRFITDLLLSRCKEDGDSPYARIANVQIDRTVAQLRAHFPEAYAGGDGSSGGNIAPLREGWAS